MATHYEGIIVRGVKGRNRKPLVRQHRLTMLMSAMDKLFDGKATPEYVSKRAKKYKEARDW